MAEQPTIPNPAPGRLESQDVRKPYAAPELIVHGTIQDLTQAALNPGSDTGPDTGSAL